MIDPKKKHPREEQDDEATVLFQESAPPARLLVTDGRGRKTQHPLLRQTTMIGSSSFNDIILDDTAAAEQHARLIISGSSHVLNDLNTEHGTRVNGAFINNHVLKDGDRIQIGRTFLQFGLMKKAVPVEVEETTTPQEATTVIPTVQITGERKRQEQRSSKVQIVRKRKGVRLFFATPFRAVLTAFMAAFLLLVILISIGQRQRAADMKPATSASGPTLVDAPPATGSGVVTDLSDRTEIARLEKQILQHYEDAGAAFDAAEARFNKVMEAPTLNSLEELAAAYRDSLQLFDTVTTLSPSFNDTDRYRSDIQNRLDTIEKRQYSIRAAQQLRIDRLRTSAREQLQQGRFDQAEATLQELLGLQPGDRDALSGLADINRRKSQSASAARNRTALKTGLAKMQAALLEGNGHYEQQKFASALESWKVVETEFNRLADISGVESLPEYAEARQILDKVEAYRQAVQPALDKQHEQARALFGRGVTFESIGELEKAAAEWRKIFEFITDPQDEYYRKASERLKKYE